MQPREDIYYKLIIHVAIVIHFKKGKFQALKVRFLSPLSPAARFYF